MDYNQFVQHLKAVPQKFYATSLTLTPFKIDEFYDHTISCPVAKGGHVETKSAENLLSHPERLCSTCGPTMTFVKHPNSFTPETARLTIHHQSQLALKPLNLTAASFNEQKLTYHQLENQHDSLVRVGWFKTHNYPQPFTDQETQTVIELLTLMVESNREGVINYIKACTIYNQNPNQSKQNRLIENNPYTHHFLLWHEPQSAQAPTLNNKNESVLPQQLFTALLNQDTSSDQSCTQIPPELLPLVFNFKTSIKPKDSTPIKTPLTKQQLEDVSKLIESYSRTYTNPLKATLEAVLALE